MRHVDLKPFSVFEVLGKQFVIRIRTLFTDCITKEQYEWLKTVQGNYELSVSDEQYEWLLQAKLISDTSTDAQKEKERDRQLWENGFGSVRPVNIELMVAQSCNMHCEYCYGTDGSYSDPGMMDEQTAFAAIDFLREQVDARPSRKNDAVSVIFFGGEPIINYDLIVKCVDYAKKRFSDKKLLFGMTTNLTLMTDQMLDFFAAQENFDILVSFDGPREYQARRVLNDGRDSYDVVTENIKKAFKKIKNIAGRATTYLGDDKEKVVREMKALGFTDYQLCGASGNLGEKIKRGDVFQEYRERTQTITDGVERFAKLLSARDATGLREMEKNEEVCFTISFALQNMTVPKRYVSCGSGRTMMAVSHDGNFYPCHRLVGQDQYRQGSLSEGFHLGDFKNNIVLANPKCERCFAKYTCGGPCAHVCACDMEQSEEGVPDIFNAPEEYCELTRQRVMLKAYVDELVKEEDRVWLKRNGLFAGTVKTPKG